jgi:hypothetical protein
MTTGTFIRPNAGYNNTATTDWRKGNAFQRARGAANAMTHVGDQATSSDVNGAPPRKSVCCRRVRAVDRDPSNEQVARVLGLFHCDIQNGPCSFAENEVGEAYPIEIDHSPDRIMRSGKRCSEATEEDINRCIIDAPPHRGDYGDNCQTQVVGQIGGCCLKSGWRPSWYAGANEKGRCLQWSPSIPGALAGVDARICLKWEFPEGFNNGIPRR